VDGRNGSYWNTGLSHEQAVETIQEAIERAQDGDTVLVWPDTYDEEIDFKGKAITVRSADDAAVLTSSRGYAVTFDSAKGAGAFWRLCDRWLHHRCGHLLLRRLAHPEEPDDRRQCLWHCRL
jgi:hypothetical protein